MNPLYGKALLFLGLIVTIVIRIPYDKRSASTKVEADFKTAREKLLLAVVAIGVMLLPLVFIFTPFLSFADHELEPVSFWLGAMLLGLNIWLFYRSHSDLGQNWSKTLEIREDHQLVTAGVYQKIRHPMYTAIFLYVFAQTLLLSNWIAGPAGFVAFSLMYLLRVGPEEEMMKSQFGEAYQSYVQRTKRLIPGVY